MSLRLQRVKELLKREIGEVIRRQLPVDEWVCSTSRRDVAPNLHNATVILGSSEVRAKEARHGGA